MIQTKTIVFDKQINGDSIRELIDTIEENLEKVITIYFNTSGGNNVDTEVLIEMLNNCSADITLVATWGINSNGFKIFFRVINIKRRLMPRAHAVVHLSSRDINTLELLQNDTPEKFLIDDLEEQNELLMEFYTDVGLTEPELETVRTGGEITLGYIRLTELLDKQEDKWNTKIN